MNIKEFSEKYCVSKRTVDYWTNCGYLHPDKSEKGGDKKYRDYTPCEKEVMNVLVLRNAGIDDKEFKLWLEALNENKLNATKKHFKMMLKECLKVELEKIEAQYKKCIDYVDKL